MPVPYMGSKRVPASKIVNLIKAYESEATEFYDVFCGGFAISEAAIRKGYKVHASDLSAAVVALIDEVFFGKCLDPKTGVNIFENPRFISREEFKEATQGDDWWSGYISCVWSFGNNGAGYLFGADVEKTKRAGHELVVDGKITPEILEILPRRACEKIIELPDWHRRRIALVRVARTLRKRENELEQLQRLEQLQQLRQLEQLQQLQQLEQLEQLQQLEQKSYDEVDIPPGAIIYCDPPYFGTASYVANDGAEAFDHQKFYDWCREKSKTNPVFISEYQMPEDFECIYTFDRRQTLSKSQNKTKPEKVFYLRRQK